MPKHDCSELSKIILELVSLHAQEPHVKNVDDVVKEMQKTVPEFTRQQVVDSIVEATTGHAQARSDLAKKLDEIKREARSDKTLRDAVAALQQELKKIGPEPSPEPPATAKETPEPIQMLRDQKGALQDQLALGRGERDIGQHIRDMARDLVDAGERNRDDLVDNVHRQVAQYGMSRDQVSDIISGYGDYKPLSKEETDVALRDLKGQLQQLAKLRDMESGQAPLKTGVERREPSDEERRLIQQVNETKKKLGIETTDPETQLKSSLDSAKTRLQHQIDDLSAQIESGKQTVKDRTKAPTNAEIEALKVKRDALKKEYNTKFSQELDAPAISKLNKKIAEMERHLAAGTLPEPKLREPVTHTPQVAELRKKMVEVRKALSKSDPSIQKRFRTQINDLMDKMARNDIVPPVKAPEFLSKQAMRLQYERDKLRSQIQERIRSLRPKSITGYIGEPLNVARAIVTSMDLSAALRQGGFIVMGHPLRGAKTLGSSLKALVSDRAAYKIEQDIENHENAPLAKRAGLYLSPSEGGGKLAAQEEAFMSRVANKIPGVKQSQRAYTAFLDKLRFDSFNAMVNNLSKHGEPTQAEAEAVANYINVATGRGGFKEGKAERLMEGLNTVFFAPRLVASRFQLLAGQPLYGGSFRTRRMIAGEYGRYLVGMAAVYALGALAGGKLEDDPRSSDFGKIVFGKTRVDPLSGLVQAIVLTSRLATGRTKGLSGELTPIYHSKLTSRMGGTKDQVPFGKNDAADIILNFVRSKLNPATGTAISALSGQDVTGNPVTPTSAAADMFTPMVIKDVYQTIREQGVSKGIALSVLAVLGMSVNTYQHDEDERNKPRVAGR